ncbi:MAG: mucoidy inhibitor MuiA family protein [Phycisphaerales bacterium]
MHPIALVGLLALVIRIPTDLHAFDPSPTAASHGGIGVDGARELTGTRITPAASSIPVIASPTIEPASPLGRFVAMAPGADAVPDALATQVGAAGPRASDAPADGSLVPRPIEPPSTITAVTLFPGRAAVTRRAVASVQQGVYEVLFAALPEAIQPDSLQARTPSGVAKVIGVDYRQTPTQVAADAELAALDARIATHKKEIARLAEDLATVAQQEKLIDAISVRATGDASEKAGTPALDLASLQKQIDFVASQRQTLLKARRDLVDRGDATQKSLAVLEADRAARAARADQTKVRRDAIVTVAAPSAGELVVELVYLVANAAWEPIYNVRGDVAAKTVAIEYDALLLQRSGEDWNDVAMTLSTAQPTTAANPPVLNPVYVDVSMPQPAENTLRSAVAASPPAPPPGRPTGEPGRGGSGGGGGSVFGTAGEADKQAEYRKALDEMSAAASVSAGGPAVTFTLPRTVTVKTNADRQQRTRIATIDAKPEFIHVARPLLTESVYLRGEVSNASQYQLLPGGAAIFLGNDFIGPTRLSTVAPGASFELFFGVDRNLKATRKLVTKNTSRTGLLGGGVQTAYDYRIEIDNPTSAPITVELMDRMPVSRNEKIAISLVNLGSPLATDAEYVNELKPQGFLKWLLKVPAGASGKTAFPVTYGVRVDHGKDVRTTGLPE